MIMRSLYIVGAILIPAVATASFRGNLNLSYQERSSGTDGVTTSSHSQILNLYLSDRIFYDNDFTIGAYIARSKLSTRDKPDLRKRYSLNMSGHRYSFYSSLSPYKIFRQGAPTEQVRVFQASLNYQPKMLSPIAASYTSTRQYTEDTPRSINGFSRSWNIGTQFSKPFGSFRITYQRQQSKADVSLPEKQVRQTVNLGYDISKRLPGKTTWAASYGFTGNRNEVSEEYRYESETHTGATQAAKGFGKWFTLSVSSSGRRSDFKRTNGESRIEDFSANSAGTVKLRDNISLIFLRGYSLSKSIDDSTREVINDYFNLTGSYGFPVRGGTDGSLSLSRAVYYKSALGPTTVDNATLLFDIGLYRQTEATVGLGLSYNSEAAEGRGRYQLSRNIDLTSRPAPRMTVNLSYQSSLASEAVDLSKTDNDHLSLNVSHLPRPYFNYSITYARSVSKANARRVISSLALAFNSRISRSLSLLTTYTRRDLGETGTAELDNIDQSLSSRLGWLATRRSNLTLNYTISHINTPRQSKTWSGYFLVSF